VNRPDDATRSPADATKVLYIDDDQLLLDLQADIAAEREAIELVTTPDTDRARALLDDREFDCVVVGGKPTVTSARRFARKVQTAHPDTPLVRYAWETSEDDADEVFDSVLEKQVEAAGTVQLLDRAKWLDD
jgi:DNA-binding NtrC family response regulator